MNMAESSNCRRLLLLPERFTVVIDLLGDGCVLSDVFADILIGLSRIQALFQLHEIGALRSQRAPLVPIRALDGFVVASDTFRHEL